MNIKDETPPVEEDKEEVKEEEKVNVEQLLVNKEDLLAHENFLPGHREMEGKKVVFFTDNYGRICKAEKRCEDLFEMDISEFLQKNFFELMDNVSIKHHHEIYGRHILRTENVNGKTIVFVLRHS